MKQRDILLDRWAEILVRRGDSPAVMNTAGQVVRTFGQIDERARDFESELEKVPCGQVMAVQIGNHEDWPSILIACLRREIVVLPLEQTINDQQRDAALEVCHASGVVATDARTGRTSISRRTRMPAAATPWGNNPPSLLKVTSGTTAAPRLIRFRSEQLLADCDQICETMKISDADLNFGVIPVSHSYGFSNLLTPLIARGVPIILSRDRTPRAVLDDLARTQATVFPGMPVFYQAFCDMTEVPNLAKLRLCISAGAPLPLVVAQKFREKLGLQIHSFYGASECGGICYDRDAKSEIDGFVGTPMTGVTLELIDPNSDSSQVRVRSPAAGEAYFPDPDEEKLGCGIFVPDDLLAREGGGFKIVGRVSDVINVAGKKVNPAEIEETLRRFPGVRQVIVFGRSAATGLRNEGVAACIVGDAALNEGDLLAFCRKNLSAWQVPKRIFVVDSIPANERGKVSRKELARRFS